MIQVGSIEKTDGGYKIDRGYYRQGWIFKDEDAFLNREDDPCYVPELSDTVYTYRDFLEMCNGQPEMAESLFFGVDWQHPETLIDEMIVNREWVICSGCGQIVDYGCGCNDTRCPHCGKEVEEE